MNLTPLLALSSLVAVVAVASCVEAPPPDPAIDPFLTGTTNGSGSGTPRCQWWGCGANSPLMGPYAFHELNVDGQKNDQLIHVLDFEKISTAGDIHYHPHLLVGDRLVATDKNGNTIAGLDLAGGWFNLAAPDGVYKLFIDHVSPDGVPFWVGAPTTNESYKLSYIGPTDPKQYELCDDVPNTTWNGRTGQYSAPVDDAPSHTWVRPYEALLFTGDRYDAPGKRVTASTYADTAGWFNIACAGSAIAKLHLNRHTTAGSPGPNGVTTTPAQRQALLKMFSGDFCGSGHAYTVKGTPLDWTNTLHTQAITVPFSTHESYWTDAGALCLDTHRLGSDYYTQVENECALPACGARWPTAAYLSSVVPISFVVTP